jgi:4-hydroxy-tetrahydrodipicolinate reductase
MTQPIIVVGYEGRMAQSTQNILKKRGRPYLVFSPKAPKELSASHFQNAYGVIDFSSPEVSQRVLKQCVQDSAPLVCGTTGFGSETARQKIFFEASKKIPIVLDSNFSVGIELLAQAAESLATHLSDEFLITDIHHRHKVDSPSGTSIKLEARILGAKPILKIQHHSARLGENPGEHRVRIEFGQESLEFRHQAYSREVFSEGALKALEWLRGKEPGIYSMREVLS